MSRHFVFRALAVCLAALLTLVSFNSTSFAAAKKSIAVGTIEGPQGDATRKRVLKNLKDSGQYEITDAEDLRPGSDKGAYSAMAQALQVDAIVVGKVSRGYDLTLNVIGPDGKPIEDVKIKGGSAPKLNKAIDGELGTSLAGPLGVKVAAKEVELEEEAPPEDEEEASTGKADDEEEDKGDAKEEEPASEPEERGRRPLEFLVGGRLYSRNFAYTDLQPLGNVFPYKVAIAPSFFAHARVYPFAFSRDDALSNVGIFGKLELGIQTTTNYQEPQPAGAPAITYQLNNGTSEWQLGLRGRLPFGESELGIFGGYGAHSFVLVGDEGDAGSVNRPDPLVPDVNYQFLRFGFDARLTFSALSIGSHFGARFLTSMKNIDQEGWWFPGATGSGIDFGIMASYQVLPFLSVAAGGDYLRYGFDFNGIPDNAGLPGSTTRLIAGGATDTYISGWLGVMFHFDNKPTVSDSSVAVEATSGDKPSEPAEEEPEEEP